MITGKFIGHPQLWREGRKESKDNPRVAPSQNKVFVLFFR